MFITIVEFDYFIKYVTVLVYLSLLDLFSLIFIFFLVVKDLVCGRIFLLLCFFHFFSLNYYYY